MLKPVNGHLLIEPVKHQSFIAQTNDTYQEIGVIIDASPDVMAEIDMFHTELDLKRGTRVYFDSWLAAKYPKDDKGGYYWLVKWEDVRAIEHVEQEVSE